MNFRPIKVYELTSWLVEKDISNVDILANELVYNFDIYCFSNSLDNNELSDQYKGEN